MNKRFLAITIISILMLCGCSKKTYKTYTMDTYAMGTYISIAIYSNEKVSEKVFNKIQRTIDDIDKRMSINNKEVESEVDKINKKAGEEFQSVSKDTFNLIKKGKNFSKDTNNSVNIAIGPIVKLWNIGFDNADIPNEKNIKRCLGCISVDDILLDEKNHSVKLNKKFMMIDLGSIAKGYVADVIKDIIVEKGYEHALLNIGGNILCIGERYDFQPYKIGIRDGNKSSEDYLGTINIKDKSVVTSGIYERNFIKNGKLYHHILDSKTGYPIDNSLLEVSIISDNSTTGDALSTAVFSMGLEKGLKYVNSKDGIEAIFVTRKNEVYTSDNIKDDFKLVSPDYILCN